MRLTLRVDGDLAVAAIRYFVGRAWHHAYPGWRRGASGLLGGGPLELTMTYPSWPRLPMAEREAFLTGLVRDITMLELVVNGRVLVRQTRLRRLFRLPAFIEAM